MRNKTIGLRCYSELALERYLLAKLLDFKIERLWHSGAEAGQQPGCEGKGSTGRGEEEL